MRGNRSLELQAQRVKLELMQVNERLSLEMDPTGLDAVRAFIDQTYPDVATRVAGVVTLIRFGGCEFIFANEWDEPCLLSKTAAGDELLRSIRKHFSS